MVTTSSKEIWRPVVGFHGLYVVSNKGVIVRLPRCDTIGRRLAQKIVPQFISHDGYAEINLSKNGVRLRTTAHRIVAKAFVVGKCAIRNTVNHKNLNKLDNRPENLEWVSHLDNVRHAIRNGRVNQMLNRNKSPIFNKRLTPKLRPIDVERIVRLRKRGLSQERIAKKYGVTQAYVSKVLRCDAWKCIPRERHCAR